MSHAHIAKIDVNALLDAEPIKQQLTLTRVMWLCVFIGVATFLWALITQPLTHLWGAYFVNLTFFMGLALGSIILTAIFQIVRARWTAPISRIAEANVAFLPWAFLLWLATYFGKESLYPWATAPFPGREWWMTPDFVYARFTVLLAALFYLLWRFVKLSLRGDIGVLREFSKNRKRWVGPRYDSLVENWKGADKEISHIQPKRSRMAPVCVILYGVIYSLFCFEMIMSMDTIWYANMFGAFICVGNIYLGWAVLTIAVSFLMKSNPQYGAYVTKQQFWDLGKMTFAFCMLWGYMFWAHYLPQWYGNLPEETQWLILRTKEFPWKGLAWTVFPMCFILPFIMLLSRDLKRTPHLFRIVCFIIFFGVWGEKYMIIMPQLSPAHIPFNLTEIGLFLGFLGAYVLSVQNFLIRYPFMQLAHPATQGKTDW